MARSVFPVRRQQSSAVLHTIEALDVDIRGFRVRLAPSQRHRGLLPDARSLARLGKRGFASGAVGRLRRHRAAPPDARFLHGRAWLWFGDGFSGVGAVSRHDPALQDRGAAARLCHLRQLYGRIRRNRLVRGLLPSWETALGPGGSAGPSAMGLLAAVPVCDHLRGRAPYSARFQFLRGIPDDPRPPFSTWFSSRFSQRLAPGYLEPGKSRTMWRSACCPRSFCLLCCASCAWPRERQELCPLSRWAWLRQGR